MELPFRLLIGVLVFGLTVPAVVAGLSAYEAQQLTSRLTREIEGLVRVAQQFFLTGGGAEDVRLDLTGGMTARVEYVAIGDAVGGPWAPAARFRVSGQGEVFLLSKPSVPMTGPDGALELGPGAYTVRVAYDGNGAVRLTVVA